MTRSDFLRIIPPGAVAVGLLDFACRLLAITPAPRISPSAIEFLHGATRLIEDPFRGAAIAGFFGLMAYFADPGYGSPSYSKDLPSSHLATFLRNRDVTVSNPTGIYFLLFDEYMSPELRGRALLLGQYFRVAVQLILGSMFVAVALPVGIMLMTSTDADRDSLGDHLATTGAAWRTVALAFVVMALLLLRRSTRERVRRRARSAPAVGPAGWRFTSGVIVALGVGGWIIAVQTDLPAFVGRPLVLGGVTGAYGSWFVARQAGELRGVFRNVWRGKELRAQGFDDTGVFALDCSIGLVSLVGVLEASSAMRLLQIGGVVTILAAALAVAYLRKHERQMSGVNSNQREWIDRNEAVVLAVARGDATHANKPQRTRAEE